MIISSIDKAFCKNLKALSKVKDDDDPKRAKLRTDYLKQRGRVHDVVTGKAMEQIHFPSVPSIPCQGSGQLALRWMIGQLARWMIGHETLWMSGHKTMRILLMVSLTLSLTLR